MAISWKNVAGKIGDAAPLLGMAVGGPAGAAIGRLVSGVLGVGDSPEEVLGALNDPSAILKLKEFEKENQAHIREHAFKVLDAELKDKQNAREIHKHSRMPAMITLLLTFIVSSYGIALFSFEIPDSNRDMLNYFGSQLIALWVASVVYWIGTTRSSAEKDVTLKSGYKNGGL